MYLALAAVDVAIISMGSIADVGRGMKLDLESMQAAKEVLSIREQYFRYIA